MRTHPPAPLALAAALGLLAPALAAAADWPRFRGPNGTGVAADKDVPVQWSEKENIVWKAAVPGEGASSPVVWGDRLFLQSAADDGSERWLLCLDARSGEVLWKKSAPGAAAKKNPKNTLASSTPCTDGERVYAAFWDGKNVGLAAYDFRGERLWARDLGPFTSQHGAGFSPVVYGGKVFLNDDQDGTAALLAFDAKTGQDAWKAERKAFRACYSTPFVRETDKGAELVAASTAGLTAYNPADGSVIWSHAWDWKAARMPLRTVASPVVAAGLIVATAGDGAGDRNAVAVNPGGGGGGNDAKAVWQLQKPYPYVPSLLAKGDYLFGVNDEGTALCFAAKTGETVWGKRLGSPFSASPVLIDGKVYAAGEDGKVYVFAADPAECKVLATNDLGEPVLATPAVADGRLFIRGKDHLFCVGKPVKSGGE